MPLFKNQIIPLKILSLSSDGNGVGKFDGQAIFVPFSAPGDELLVKIVKPSKSYSFGIIDTIHKSSEHRIEPDCDIFKKCGGCAFRHISYEQELEQKQGFVQDSMYRLGKIDVPVATILPSEQTQRYRNKVQLPVYQDETGIHTGFYAGRSHRVVPCADCMLQPQIFTSISQFLCKLLTEFGTSVYDERSHKGLLRHIYLRHALTTDKVMVCFVLNGKKLPYIIEIAKQLTEKFPQICSIILNINKERTNVVLGKKFVTQFGNDVLEDILSEVPVALSPLSFYQINTLSAERLYAVASVFAALKATDILLDLYCGAGTIGLSMAHMCKELVGVEIVADAVENAKQSAIKMGVKNASFICADASEAASALATKGFIPNVIIVDPPRRGCDEATLMAICKMAPSRIVMVSCNAATAARDCNFLQANGYLVGAIQPVDMFPRTTHVETVCLLSKLKSNHHIEVNLNMDELDLTSAESKATYEEIKEYVLENIGFKVSSLYIGQVKEKMGIKERENYNISKKEDARVPKCPADKEKAIIAALKHFSMID